MPRQSMSKDEHTKLMADATERAETYDGSLVMVNVSGGAASALAWKRCIDHYGKDRVQPVFADTRSEDPDTYRFLDDCERAFGQTLTRLDQGHDIWDCFDKHGMMRIASAGNACKASVELKQKPLADEKLRLGADAQVFGMTYDEPERILAVLKRKPDALFPLLIPPRLGSCEILAKLDSDGIKPPAVYQDGFIHNNCLGAGGCILAGLSQWAAVAEIFPDRFEYAEKREAKFSEEHDGFTVLRDQRDRQVKHYALAELREELEQGRDFGRRWKSTCGCMTPMLFDLEELQ